MAEMRIGDHCLKISEYPLNREMGELFFSQRAVSLRNSSRHRVVKAMSLNDFKAETEIFLRIWD